MSDRRPAASHGGGRRSKKAKYGNKSKNSSGGGGNNGGGGDITTTNNGCSGFLINCDTGKENPAAREAIDWLERSVAKFIENSEIKDNDDEDDDEVKRNSNDDKPTTVSNSLEHELQQLRHPRNHKTKQQLFVRIPVRLGGNVFIAVTDPTVVVDVAALAVAMLNEARITGSIPSRYCVRLLPVQHTCYSSMNEVTRIAKTFIQTKLSSFVALVSSKNFDTNTTTIITLKVMII